jgi:hypothetical protein
LSTSSLLIGDPDLLPPEVEVCFRLSFNFGIFMLLKRLLRRLLLFAGVVLATSDDVSDDAIGGGGAGQFISSEMELPVGEIGGSSSSFCRL